MFLQFLITRKKQSLLDHNETLVELNLSWNQIRRDGIHDIARGLGVCNKLDQCIVLISRPAHCTPLYYTSMSLTRTQLHGPSKQLTQQKEV